ncbi:hypothetical protein SAMN04487943_101314 [Gracilibacillus orientalis]|uniref:Uncharacterized protein n=1 Tax=Gracilibacillus orientalis TaxID=334253 RepID=A0A1I4HA99_9BACI|nr:hypothetical protein [Gracilibacillus orientalis]SFL39144.1 hypothetical protein SAMN04487943_101314 [Gracilibacillus orientalis]
METSDYLNMSINIILVLITLGTVIYAKKNVIATDSPRVIITNYKETYSHKDENFFKVGVSVKNFGNGVAIKTFLLLIVVDKQKRKHYFLSKPISGLESKMIRETEIELTREQISNEMITSMESPKKYVGAFVISQDFFNNLYWSPITFTKNEIHLQDFVIPINRISKLSLKYRIVKRQIKKTKKQKNTYVDRISNNGIVIENIDQKFIKK